MTASLPQQTTQAFTQHLGHAPSLQVRAPGRVNLIGEHTDYNDGFVLPCAIDFETHIAARARPDRQVRVCACDYGNALDQFDLDAPITPRLDVQWANYVRGVVQTLLARGLQLGGVDLAIAGNVPQGAGLSSSASLEVAVAQVFNTLHNSELLTRTDIALVAQKAENTFVGVNCGIMDQLISACGRANHALLIDCRSLTTQAVPLPNGLAIMIVHSHVQRGLVGSAYNTRRQQCEAAAAHYQVKALRDVDLTRLQRDAAGLDPLVLRRARHIVSENQRTLDAAQALATGDLLQLGQLMAASHHSMRDDFEITVPAIDQLVTILQTAIGPQGGARMTGGGFGGCVVALLPQTAVPAARAAVAAHYRAPNGEAATVYVCQASAGVSASYQF